MRVFTAAGLTTDGGMYQYITANGGMYQYILQTFMA